MINLAPSTKNLSIVRRRFGSKHSPHSFSIESRKDQNGRGVECDSCRVLGSMKLRWSNNESRHRSRSLASDFRLNVQAHSTVLHGLQCNGSWRRCWWFSDVSRFASLTGRRGPLTCRIFSRLGFELMHLRPSSLRSDTLPRISPFSLNLPRQTPSVTATNTLMVNSERAMSFVSQFRENGPVRGSSAGPTNRSGQNCVRLKWVTSRSNHGRYLDFKSMPAVTGAARQPPQRRFPKACDSADEPSRN